MIIPLTAAIIFGLALAHYKWAISRTNLETKTFLCTHFLTMFGVGALAAWWWGSWETPLFSQPRYIGLFLIIVSFGLVYNYFLVRGFKRESLHEYELIDLLMPIFTVVLAAIAFVDEREPVRIGLALLGASVFLITHWRRHQVVFKQADRWLVYAVFLMALERVLVKPILTIIDPIVLYTLRTGLISLILLFFFRPRLARIPAVEWLQLVINGLLGVTSMVLIWTSINQFGVVVTELYLLVTPIVLAIVSLFFFKERWTLLQVWSFVVILASIGLMNQLL